MASLPAQKEKFNFCVGSRGFVPDEQVQDAEAHANALARLESDDFASAIKTWFRLRPDDGYVYHAVASVRLDQVQKLVRAGDADGLQTWYWSEDGAPLPPPSVADIATYTSVFLPSCAAGPALKSFLANAKKSSLRFRVASHLLAQRFLQNARLAVPKAKKAAPPNPYLDFWAWSSRTLGWCGPLPETEKSVRSHPVLAVLMHHFSCAVPTHEALSMLRHLTGGRIVVDVGSGNGYWTFMMRAYGLRVVPVDNGQSEWRTMWVADTVKANGARWLVREENGGAKDMVLLMVYPIVGGGVAGGLEGGFTRRLVEAYQGDTLAVVGTQNHNGYTSFRSMTMSEYMEREQPDWVKVVQLPLPSFAGKDDALFVFQRVKKG